MSIFYTQTERTEKKFTIEGITAAALFIVKDRSNERITTLNTKSLLKYSIGDLFTMPEFNDVVQKVVNDSFAYPVN